MTTKRWFGAFVFAFALLAGGTAAFATKTVHCVGSYVVYRGWGGCEVCHQTTCTIDFGDGTFDTEVSSDWCEPCTFGN
jgi:hypothetical protein